MTMAIRDARPFDWLGRYLDTLGPLDPLYAWNGTPTTPRLLLAPIHQVPAIPRCPGWLVELAGIEPASSGVEPGLLRVQSAMALSRPRRSH